MRALKLELNFLPPAILKRRQRRRNFLLYSPLVFLGVIVIAGFFYFPHYLAGKYQAEIARYNQKYELLAPAQSYYQKLQETKADYERSHRNFRKIQEQQVDLIGIIDGISEVLPPEVNVTSLEVDSSEGINLVFETDSALRTAQFIVGLRNLSFFEEVEPKGAPLRGELEEVKLEMPFKGLRARTVVGDK